jgi:GlcNAc-PI de-N-acetylase
VLTIEFSTEASMVNEPYTRISFYIVAHADDWLLFMQPNAFNDLIAPQNRVVFVISTAGDAGEGERYWKAREEGAKSSIRFCLAPRMHLVESWDTRDFNGHSISYWSSNNVTCYFLRLPDGNLDGNGFPQYNYESLSKFKAEHMTSVTALDNSTTYISWSDFYNTLQAIILSESSGISDMWINYLNPSTTENPNDHSDHIATGQAIQAMGIIPNLQQALFTGYNSNETRSLDQTDYFWKVGMFAAYEKAVFDASGYSTLKEGIHIYLKWCSGRASFITR